MAVLLIKYKSLWKSRRNYSTAFRYLEYVVMHSKDNHGIIAACFIGFKAILSIRHFYLERENCNLNAEQSCTRWIVCNLYFFYANKGGLCTWGKTHLFNSVFSSWQNSHQEFSKMKQSNNESNLREEVLKNLAVANDNFVELVANLKEGTKVWVVWCGMYNSTALFCVRCGLLKEHASGALECHLLLRGRQKLLACICVL